jgi:hypothetical protein
MQVLLTTGQILTFEMAVSASVTDDGNFLEIEDDAGVRFGCFPIVQLNGWWDSDEQPVITQS